MYVCVMLLQQKDFISILFLSILHKAIVERKLMTGRSEQ